MKEIDTAVLGDGVSALSCLVFNDEAKAFTRAGGHHIKDMDIGFGPMYLHSTPHTREFYQEFFNIDPDTISREINFKYLYDGEVKGHLDEDALVEYYRKSRGTDDIKEKKTVGSEQETSFRIIEKLPDFAERAYDRVEDRIRESEEGVTSINLQKRTFEFDGETYRFKNLVSTVPAPVFKSLLENPDEYDTSEEYQSTGTTFYVLENPKVDIDKYHLDDISDLDYLYFPKQDLYRATVYKQGLTNTWTVEVNESNDEYGEGDIITVGDGSIFELKGEIKRKIPIPSAKTLNEVDLPKVGGVYHAGRFARWQHSVKTDSVIKRLMTGDIPITKGGE